ncbi:MAG: FAD-dependent oxidoreductase [Rhizobiales bacterium]|nr:FAD-dependent oxidoreductase [Hyphomicrobiales bacterium]OJU31101.1 MAG: dihydrolipoamide dehydrogenase [Rhizobiales bacterium 68-8]
MTKLLTPDICVIGAGAGGLTVAAGAAAFGVPVVLVEKGRMGGDCLNFGCVPSKALIAAASLAAEMRGAGRFGIASVEPDVDFRAVHRHVQSAIAAIAPNDSAERFGAMGVQVIAAEARFRDRRTVLAGEHEIRARRFVIATGSRPIVPPIPGLGEVGYLTNETVFDLTRRPSHLLVIGGGPAGLELAQAHRRLGCQVTVVEAATPLAGEDPELAAFVLRALRADGVDIRTETSVVRVEPRGRSGVRALLDSGGTAQIVDASHILVAAGRRPALDGLDLDKAGIRHDERGIRVGDGLRTSNRWVYAIGDAAGGPQFTHVAGHHGGQVLRPLLFRLSARANHAAMPRVTFTRPELAQVGLTEAQARAVHRRIAVLRWPYGENDRAQAERATEGLVKLIAGPGGRILGVGIVGAGAGELIGTWQLALSKDMRLKDMAAWVPPYPTLSEIGKRAAISYFAPQARRPSVRRLVRLLRRFG